MKKYIILLSITFFILSSILIVDYCLGLRKAHKLNEHINTKAAEQNTESVLLSSQAPQISVSKVPILMYHSISDLNPNSSLFVSPSSFEAQINYLKQNNYNFINFEDLANENISQNPVMLTFDDGYEDLYTNAYPILKKNNVKATIFIITGNIGKQGYLSLDEIKAMEGLISFQSHTVSHVDLKLLTESQLEREFKKSKEVLESIVQNKIVAISYPSGSFNSNVTAMAEKYYKYGITTISGTYNIDNDRYKIPRIRVSRRDNIENFEGMIIKQ